jgi:hypothetical protein
MKSQAQRFMSFLLGPGVTALSDSFSKFFRDGSDHSRAAGLREAAGHQGTICRALRVQCGTAMSTSSVRMMASFEFAPDTAKIVCERPYFDRRAVMTALGLG